MCHLQQVWVGERLHLECPFPPITVTQIYRICSSETRFQIDILFVKYVSNVLTVTDKQSALKTSVLFERRCTYGSAVAQTLVHQHRLESGQLG